MIRSSDCSSLRRSLGLLVIAAGLLAARDAGAYPWMIRREITDCASCHVDPSGAGLLTHFGRSEGDQMLRMHSASEAAGVSPRAQFLWGVVGLPEWLNMGGQFRGMVLRTMPEGAMAKSSTAFILMQADLAAEARVGGFRANATAGFVSSNNSKAAVAGSFVSREHWLGWGTRSDSFLIRVGRINLPFGVRMIEHTMFVRMATRTDLNDTQQDGLAIAYSGERLRTEIMGIAGNYQASDDKYRERGYSGYAEWALADWATLGVSSLVTHVAQDPILQVANTRQAHGLFARAAPIASLALLAEADYVLHSMFGDGTAAMLQADWEPVRSLHVIAASDDYFASTGHVSWQAWFGLGWFFARHLDLRMDAVRSSLVQGNQAGPPGMPAETQRVGAWAFIAQLHLYL